MPIGGKTRIGSKIADHEFDRVKGSFFQRSNAGIRSIQSVTLEPVVSLAAFTEGRILPVTGMDVDLPNGGFQPSWHRCPIF